MRLNQFLLVALLLLSINVSAITKDFNKLYGDSLTIGKEIIFTDKTTTNESDKVFYKTDTVTITSDTFLFEKTGGLRFEGKVLLILNGTAANPVVLKNVSRYDPTGVYWKGLSFSKGARCRINYCQLINANCNPDSYLTSSCSFTGAGATDSIVFNHVVFDSPDQYFTKKRNCAIFFKDIPSFAGISLKNINVNETFQLGLYIDKCYPNSLTIDKVVDRSDTMLYCTRSIPELKFSNSKFFNISSIFFCPPAFDISQVTKVELSDNNFICKDSTDIYIKVAQNTFKNLAVGQFVYKSTTGNDTVNVNNLCLFYDCKIGEVIVNGLNLSKSHGGFKFEHCSKIGNISILNSKFRNVFYQDWGILRIMGTGKDSINSVYLNNNKFDTISSYFEGAILYIDNSRYLNSIKLTNNKFNNIKAELKNVENSYADGGIGYLRNIVTLGNLEFSGNKVSGLQARSGGVIMLEGGSGINLVSFTNDTINDVNVLSGGAVQIQGTTTIDSVNIAGNIFKNFKSTGNGSIINVLKITDINFLNSSQNSFLNDSAFNGGAIALDSIVHIKELNVGGELSINNTNSTGSGGYIYINAGNIDSLTIGGSKEAQTIKSTSKNGDGGFAYIRSGIGSLKFINNKFDFCTSGGNGGVCYLDLLNKPKNGFRLENLNIINATSKKSGGSFYLNFYENPGSIVISNNRIGTSSAEMDGGFVALNLKGSDTLSYIQLNNNSVGGSCTSNRNGGLFNVESKYSIILKNGLEMNENTGKGNIASSKKGGILNSSPAVNISTGICDISRNNFTSCAADSGAFVRFKLDGNGSLLVMNNKVASIQGRVESNLFFEIAGKLKTIKVTDNSFASSPSGYTTGFIYLKGISASSKIQNAVFSKNKFSDYQNNVNSNSSFIQISTPIDSIAFLGDTIISSTLSGTIYSKVLSIETSINDIKEIKIEGNTFNSKIKSLSKGGCYSISARNIENISLKDDVFTQQIEAKAGGYLNIAANTIQSLFVGNIKLMSLLLMDKATVGGAFINISAIDLLKPSSVKNIQIVENKFYGGLGEGGPLLFIDIDSTKNMTLSGNKVDFSIKNKENIEPGGSFLRFLHVFGTVKFEGNTFNSIQSKSSGIIFSSADFNAKIDTLYFKKNTVINCSSSNLNGSLADIAFSCNQLLFSNNTWENNTSFSDYLIGVENKNEKGFIEMQNDVFRNNKLQLNSNKKGVIAIANGNKISIQKTTFDNDSLISGRALYLKMCNSVAIEKCSFTKFNSYKYGVAVFDSILNCTVFSSVFKNNKCSRRSDANREDTYGGITLRFPTNFLIDSCSFLGNSSHDFGGAIAVLNSDDHFVFLKNSNINYNSAATGAGVFCQNSNLTVDHTSFFANTVQYDVSNGKGEGVLNLSYYKDTSNYYRSFTCNIQDCRFELNEAPKNSSVVSQQYNKISMIRNVFYNNRCIKKDGAHIQFQAGSYAEVIGEGDSLEMYNNLMYYNGFSDYDNNDIECIGDETDFLGFYNCTFYATNRLTENNRDKTILHKSEFGSSKSKINFFNSIHYKDIQFDNEFTNCDTLYNYGLNNPINFFDDSLKVNNSALIVDKGSDKQFFNDLHMPPGEGSGRNDIGITGGPYNDWGEWWIPVHDSISSKLYINSVLIPEGEEKMAKCGDKISIKIIHYGSEIIYDNYNEWNFEPKEMIENFDNIGDSISFYINCNKNQFETLKVTYNNYFSKECPIKIQNNVQSYKNLEINFFPNPADEYLSIKGDLDNIKNIQLINLSGLVVRKWNIKELSDNRRMDISGVKPGIYIIVAGSGYSQIIKKVIIE